MNDVTTWEGKDGYALVDAVELEGMRKDRELLDWLQKQNDQATYTGFCCFRRSVTGRGWRLHETSGGGLEDVDACSFRNVRDAIQFAIDEGI